VVLVVGAVVVGVAVVAFAVVADDEVVGVGAVVDVFVMLVVVVVVVVVGDDDVDVVAVVGAIAAVLVVVVPVGAVVGVSVGVDEVVEPMLPLETSAPVTETKASLDRFGLAPLTRTFIVCRPDVSAGEVYTVALSTCPRWYRLTGVSAPSSMDTPA
jgi:hypothetical protein